MRKFTLPLVFTAFLGSVFLASIGHAQEQYDRTPAFFKTESVLPSYVRMSGINYQIAPTVQNDGAVNRYTLTVKGETYKIDTTDLLLFRLRELKALDIMDLRSGSSVFKSAVGDAVTAPIKGAKNLITSPVKTVGNFVSGVGSFFESLGHAAIGSSNDEEAGVLRTAIGYGATRRGIAKGFGIDPYTSFPPVKAKLSQLSWASTSGSFGTSTALSAIPGAAGGVIGLTKSTQGFGQLVYDKSPADLKDTNENRLNQMKVSPALIREFLHHPSYSPSLTTSVVDALAGIGAKNRGAFISRAILVNTETAAFFMMRWAQMYAAYNLKIKPIRQFMSLGASPIVQRDDGVLIVAVPTDHLMWTPGLENDHHANMARIRKMPGVTGGEVWLTGTISALARKKLEAQNWVIKENQGPALGVR